MTEMIQGPIVRECGNNPPRDSNEVVRVDASKTGLFQRIGKILQPEKPPARPAPRPPVDPVKELPRQRELLKHLEGQLAIVRARTEDKMPGQMTALQAAAGVCRDYGHRLGLLEDVAGERSADVGLLWNMLDCRGEGLIPSTKLRIMQLESQLRPPATPSEEHRRLIARAEKALRNFGESYRALRDHEQTLRVGLRHEFRGPRPTCGMNFGHVDANTLQRVAAFAATLPDSTK